MPEQTNIDNYAYERDLILLNNLLMKRLLQQRMRINNLNEKNNNNNNSSTNINNNNNNSNNSKKTISDVFVPASSFGHSQSSRDLKKNFSMVEPRKNVTHTTIEQPVMARRSTRQQQQPPQQHHHHQHHNHNNNNNNHHHHHHHSHQSRIASRANKIQINTSNISHNTSQNTSEPLSTVNEETQTEKITKLRTISSNSERSDETTVTPCDEKPATSPGNTSNAPTASSSMSATPDSDKSFRKNTPTRPYTSRKSTVSKFNIKLPACKQSSNSKCCDEKQNKKSSINYSSNNNSKYVPNTVCNNNMQSSFYPPPPPIPPPTTIQMNPFRPYNYQAPSTMNPNPFFYPYNNNYNYSIMRTNFNSYPQFSPLQSFNYQSNPFYLQTSNFFQPRSLEPLKPIKPLPMTHFQQTPLNGQSIIVL